jgi:hypothetical protein
MDPVTWAYAASAVVGAIGAVESANASAASSRAQAAAAQTNATIAKQNAHNTLLATDANEEADRRKSAYTLSQQRNSLLSAGIGAEGSAADVYAQSAGNAELDALNIRYQGTQQANNYANQSVMYSAQADAANQSASNAEDAGTIGAATSLLSGGAKAYGAYTDYLNSQPKLSVRPPWLDGSADGS